MSMRSRKNLTLSFGALRAAGARPLYRGVFTPSAGLRRRSGGEDAAAGRAGRLASLEPPVVRLLSFVLFRALPSALARRSCSLEVVAVPDAVAVRPSDDPTA